MQKRNNFTISD